MGRLADKSIATKPLDSVRWGIVRQNLDLDCLSCPHDVLWYSDRDHVSFF
ncbi:MAG: hypothetical protein RLZZ435_3077 [Cyanobacteriota bacterium]|jgi:hypothetical protein